MYQTTGWCDVDPGGQGAFYSGHKITILIWPPVDVSKDLSKVDLSKVISQVGSQTKVRKLHMPIQHINHLLV